MIRRIGIGGLVLVLTAATVATANAEPSGVPAPTGTSAFKRLDTSNLGKITNVPQLAKRDKVVSALVQLSGDPVAVQRAKNGAVTKTTAVRRVKVSQDAAIPKIKAAGATTYGRLTTVLNAVQVRVKVADLAKVAAVPGVTKVQVSKEIKRENSAGNRYTGVDRAWQYLGRTGAGQTIGVIDTGIDYTHADFGGPGTVAAYDANDGSTIEPGSFPTAKVTGGYDFVGDDYNAASDDPADLVPNPDPDPLDCEGHGTHVAGTAAGSGVTTAGTTYTGPYDRATTGKKFDVEPGAAPAAKLKAYRVFGCEGSVNDDVVVAAIDRATSDGVDVINMSLGGSFGANNLDDVAIANATSAGVLVVVSAGNDGAGAYIVGSPSTSDTALSVAAADTEFASYPGVKITGAATATGLIANGAAVTSPITGTLVDVGLGCEASDYAGVAGKIALSTRGVCPRTDRATLGQAAGAKAVIMINTDPALPPFEGVIAGVTIPFVGVSSTSGPALLAADGKSVTLTAASVTNPNYGGIADFSSNGPRYGDSAQKPDVAAPGVSVPSAAVGTGTGYIRESGTSMAAPHTAGVAALVRQSHPSWTARQIKAMIQSTGQPSRVKDYDSQRAGTGMVQPLYAARGQVYAWTSSDLNSLKFGMNELSGAHVETQTYKVTNRSTSTFTYDLAAELSTSAGGATLTISPKSFTIKGGETKKVAVTMRFSRYDVNRLPGVGASDGGVVSSIHGRIVATPRKANPVSPVLQTTFMFVPVPLSKVQSSTTVGPAAGGKWQAITAKNNGSHAGRATLYSWLLADAAGDAFDPLTPDVTNLGVATYPGTAGGGTAADRLMVFAVSQVAGTSTQSLHEIDVAIDTDGDGAPNYFVIGFDIGALLAGTFDGTYGSFVVDADSGVVTAGYVASAPANGSTVTLPVLASDLGLTGASQPIGIQSAGFSVYGTGADEFSGTATYNPFKPVTNSSTSAVLKPGQSATFPTTVDVSQLGSQTYAGWLVVTPDDRSGLAEADRVKLSVPKSLLTDAGRVAKPR